MQSNNRLASPFLRITFLRYLLYLSNTGDKICPFKPIIVSSSLNLMIYSLKILFFKIHWKLKPFRKYMSNLFSNFDFKDFDGLTQT
jgi:hypothetical protein